MSIETERWTAHPGSVAIRDGATGEWLLSFEQTPPLSIPEEERWAWCQKRIAAVAVLPEALALLKQLATVGDDLEFIRDEAGALLMRAGVLP